MDDSAETSELDEWLTVSEASRVFVASDSTIRQRAAVGRLDSKRQSRDGREVLVVERAGLARLFFGRDEIPSLDRRTLGAEHRSYHHNERRAVVDKAKGRAHRTAVWMLRAAGAAVVGEAAVRGLTAIIEMMIEGAFSSGGFNETDEDLIEDIDRRYFYWNFSTVRERLALAVDAGVFDSSDAETIREAWAAFLDQMPSEPDPDQWERLHAWEASERAEQMGE